MSPVLHKVYLATMAIIVMFAFAYLSMEGYSYYRLKPEERFYDEHYKVLKPSGTVGHGLGIAGAFFMVAGVSLYMVRKRIRRFSRVGILKHWLEFHIFLCSLGPILILFHTAFKFGGIVAVSFWSMVAVVASGVIGRYIYLQIPRTIEGRELSLSELNQKKADLKSELQEKYQLSEELIGHILNAVKARPDRTGGNTLIRFGTKFKFETSVKKQLRKELKNQHMERGTRKEIMSMVGAEIALNRKIDRLVTMQNLFKYWHVAHLPFAIVMLLIMIVHVVVALAFGYKWIF